MFTQLKLDSFPTGLSFFLSIFLLFVLAPHGVAEQHVLVGSYNNPPKIFTDKNGQTLGFWPELIEYIAEKEGWVITYVPGSWNEGLERLKNKKIDVLPDVAFTKNREQLYTFSNDPVMVSWSRLYVHQESCDFESLQDLSWKKIAVLQGSVNFVGVDGFKELAERFNLPCTFVEFKSYDDVFKAIEERTVDAGITNRDFGNKKENDFQVRKTSFIFQPISIKFALPKDSELTPVILSGINEQLDKLFQDRDSIYYELLTKHFESEVAEKKVEVFPRWLENVLRGAIAISLVLLFVVVISRVQVKRKTAELQGELKERQRAEEQFRLVFEHAPVSLWHEDFSEVQECIDRLRQSGVHNFREYFKMHPETVKECANLLHIIDVNRASLELHQAKDKKELIASLPDTFTEESFRVFEEELIALANGEVSFQADAVVQTLDGREKDVILQLVVDSTTPGSMDGYVALTDITERKVSEAEKTRLMSAIDQATEVIVITDAQGMIQYTNPAFETLTGYTREEVIGRNPRILKSGQHDDNFYKEMWEALLRGETWKGHLINKRKDGSFFEEETTISPVMNSKGKIDNFVAVKRDISREVSLEKELSLAHKMKTVGLMAGGVAHDLNNILSGIIGYPELMLQQLPNDSELREPIEAIKEAGERAATVVADLLTVARGAASVREVHNLNSLIQEYLNSPECKKLKSLHQKITCQHQLEATQATISCSPVHVKKCLMNLTTNAVESIVDHGTVVVSTHDQYIDDLASAEQNMEAGEYVVLGIRDSGPGISDMDLEYIFEPFYSRKVMGRSGTGLGLTVVWNTMKDHGGKIFVESSDTGTYFQLYFPVNKEGRAAQAKNIEKAAPRGTGESILVVDDEPHLRDIASQMLSALGYRVESVCSGELAIEFLKENQVDLIIIDMLMEPGMNGRQSYEKILEIHPGQKAIVASGFSESDDIKAALRLGAGGFIKKPYSMDKLGQVVQEALAN